MSRTVVRLLSAVLLLFFGAETLASAETIVLTGGSCTWPSGDAGLKGEKIPGTNAAKVTVTTKTTVNGGHTAKVKYQIGVVSGGTFVESASYTRNLTAGADQEVSNTFTGLAQVTQYTVKVSIQFDALNPSFFGDRTITVNP